MLTVGDLFSGIGGFSLGLERAGMRTRWFSEIDPYASAVLRKHWADVPNHGDVRNVGRGTVEPVDVLCGGFPCQDISNAGKRAGIDGERSGLWAEYARVIGELRPRYVIVENVSALLGRGLGRVLGDLAALGFDARWDVLSAADCGAFHIRERIWIVAAHPDRLRQLQRQGRQQESRRRIGNGTQADAHAGGTRSQKPGAQPAGAHGEQGRRALAQRGGWPAEPGLVRMVHGVPNRVDRIRALGNAQVPRVAATAWEVLMTPNADLSGRTRSA